MKTSLKKTAIILMTCAFMFTTLPIATGSYSYAAAPKRPAQVKALKVIAKTQSSVTIRWNEVKNAKGYVIYRYDYKAKKWKAIKKVSAKTLKYKNTKLKAGTKYAYKVRAYKAYKQYYNSKTKKWVNKKPANKYWKKKKTRTRYLFGKYSAAATAVTKKAAAKKTTSANKDSKFKVSMWDIEYDIYKDGNKVTIIATSSGKVTWTSSNTAVATVKASETKAVITLLKEGKTTITATNWDGQKKSVVFTVRDTTPEPDITKKQALAEVKKYMSDGAYRIYKTMVDATDKANSVHGDVTSEAVRNVCIENKLCRYTKFDNAKVKKIAEEYNHYADIGKKEGIDLSADEWTRYAQARDAATALASELWKKNGGANCITFGFSQEVMFSYAGLDWQGKNCWNDKELMGEKGFKEFYGNNDVHGHFNLFVWINGKQYISDHFFGLWDIQAKKKVGP